MELNIFPVGNFENIYMFTSQKQINSLHYTDLFFVDKFENVVINHCKFKIH